MATNKSESAKFAQAADQAARKLSTGVETALADNAARGFHAPSGDTLAAILGAIQETKGTLVEANGKIYDERREVIFQEQLFAMKLVVKITKLALEAYREMIFNAIAIEQAEQAAETTQNLADVERLNVDTEKRQVALIYAKAEIEQRINVYRGLLVDEETETLPMERELVLAQLATAEKKLEIIDSIFQVLAAEQLVLAAEQRRAASLTLLMDAQRILAEIKREMVPYYIEKADARLKLADAVTEEAAAKEQIERLGYDRLDLEQSKEDMEHQVREANLEYELAQEANLRAQKATELLRNQFSRLLQEYANLIRESILEKKLELEKDGIEFKLDSHLARLGISVNDDISMVNYERGNLTLELLAILQNMELQAQDQQGTIRDGAYTKTSISQLNANITRKIIGG